MDIFIPDDEGGCKILNKCLIGENYCIECEESELLCKKCNGDYYPDEIGGCSYANNCEISFKGNCLQCKENYILIGGGDNPGIKICKSLNMEDLLNCVKYNLNNGSCLECKQGYYLNSGDHKCNSIENCYESSFDVCTKCNNGYILNKKENKCIQQTENFQHCKQTVDGKTCDICDDDYYFDKEDSCVNTNNCEKRENSEKCQKCESGYYLTEDEKSCVNTENCKNGNQLIGICYLCNNNYYLDFKDGKCKSNQEDNSFKYCKMVENNECLECIDEYFLGEDNKCSNSKNCSESDNGVCINCIDNYFLTNDNECTNVEHCIRSNGDRCEECEENYYFSFLDNKFLIAEGKFENCKFSVNNCLICKDNYYLNQSDYFCYNNIEDNNFYKCILTNTNGDTCIVCAQGYNYNSESHKCIKIG